MLCSIQVASAQPAPWVAENSLGMKFVRIPAGEFFMGSDETVASLQASFPQLELKRLDELSDEMPLHRVKISRAFDLGQTEVTKAQFEKFLNLSGYIPESIKDQTGGYGYSIEHDRTRVEKADAFAGRDPIYSWKNPGFEQGPDHPVVNITWNDAMALAHWLSQKEGKVYRLPTEAEWEYACRAGSTTRFYFGDDQKQLDKYAWYKDNSDDKFQRAGLKLPNAWGLYDMLGNVSEWTLDHYEEKRMENMPPNSDNPFVAPNKLRYPKVIRGGGYLDEANELRTANRTKSDPLLNRRDPQIPKSKWWLTDAPSVGFRIVRPLVQPSAEEINEFYKQYLGK